MVPGATTATRADGPPHAEWFLIMGGGVLCTNLCLLYIVLLFQVILRPVENTVVSFRGDACHRVEWFSSAKGTARVSLVVEQYRLKPREMARMLPLTSSVAFDGIDFD